MTSRIWQQLIAVLLASSCILVLAQSSGQEVYEQLCVICHQQNGLGSVTEGGLLGDQFHDTRQTGRGLTAGFPPLVPNLAIIDQLPGGRDYLISVLLFGVEGSMEVEGQVFDGIMPAWEHLSDEALAAVLNYTLHLSDLSEGHDHGLYKPKLIAPSDIEALRQQARKPEENCQTRSALGLACHPNE